MQESMVTISTHEVLVNLTQRSLSEVYTAPWIIPVKYVSVKYNSHMEVNLTSRFFFVLFFLLFCFLLKHELNYCTNKLLHK